MKNLILGIMLILLLVGCASKKDFKDFTIEDMKKDCNGKDEFKSCYRLGNQYLKENNKKEALHYFSQGCFSFYNSGIRKDKKSCLKEAEIIKNDEKFVDNELNKSKMAKSGDYYYENNDFTKAYEYYQEYFKYKSILLEQIEYDKDVYYNMSQILLNGLGGISQNIKLSETYFLIALRREVSSVINKSLRKYSILRKYPTMEMKIEILTDGKVSNIVIIKAPNDETVVPKLEKDLMKHTFPLIPNEYVSKKIIIPINISKE